MSDTLPAFRLDEMPTPEYATEIIFEGTRCVVIAPEDYAAMYARIAELESALAATKKRADNEQWWVTHYSLESGRYLDALRRIAVTNDSDCGLDANAMTLIARAAIAKEGK